MTYQPPFTLTAKTLNLIASISEQLGRLSVLQELAQALRLRRVNQIRSIQGSLAIEGNTLSVEQITAVLDGKPVIAPPKEVQEEKNALAVYERFDEWNPLFASLPIESLVFSHQSDYYNTIGQGTAKTDCVPFIEFMLEMIEKPCVNNYP